MDFHYPQQPPTATALFRAEYEDFQVIENLGFSLSGEGEHLYLQIEKRGENTRWIAKLLAEFFEVEELNIGYCGLKDRRAVTRQWFSVHLPKGAGFEGLTEGAELPEVEEYQVISMARHHKKLRRGAHQSNQFCIRLRELRGDRDSIEYRLKQIAEQGVPNYFGEQRFGHGGGNLPEADRLLAETYGADRQRGRRKRGAPRGGIYLSAARSYLFNLVLSERVYQDCWDKPLAGEAVPSGPMWGRGRSGEPESVRELEASVLSEWQDWTNALEFSGLNQERRTLALHPVDMKWQWLPSEKNDAGDIDLELSFSLPTGGYATSVLREIAVLQTPWADVDH